MQGLTASSAPAISRTKFLNLSKNTVRLGVVCAKAQSNLFRSNHVQCTKLKTTVDTQSSKSVQSCVTETNCNLERYYATVNNVDVLKHHSENLCSSSLHDDTEYSLSSNTYLNERFRIFKNIQNYIGATEGGLGKFSQGFKVYGLNRGGHQGKTGLWYREWAPNAKSLFLVGDFNNWMPESHHKAIKNDEGTWSLFLPDSDDGRSRVMCLVETSSGSWVERIPAWIKYTNHRDHKEGSEFKYTGVYWDPTVVNTEDTLTCHQAYTFQYPRPPKSPSLKIYRCHVGNTCSTQVAEVNIRNYNDFRTEMLPLIHNLGYNAIQMTAVQQHTMRTEFDCQVTNLFAVNSFCGNPEELKEMIDEAHRLGLAVYMDIVHSHVSKEPATGLESFDGTESMYFLSEQRGNHWMWNSKLFDYGKLETLRFLISNARWWMDEYNFDGYLFDGVTSMMYRNHGLCHSFTGNYKEDYFGANINIDAVIYLMLVNELLHGVFPTCITIGQDSSGMPAFCQPCHEGGIGFDHRFYSSRLPYVALDGSQSQENFPSLN